MHRLGSANARIIVLQSDHLKTTRRYKLGMSVNHNGVSLPLDRGLVAPRTGNAKALLNEALRLLEELALGGEGGSIDLRSVPLTAGDMDELHEVLGTGAIDAHVNALGESRVTETRFPGIWWVTHRNGEGETVAELIEVCGVPAILHAPKQDIVDGTSQLRQLLDQTVRAQ